MADPIPYTLSEHKVYITTYDDKVLDISEGCDDTGFTVNFDNDSITYQESPNGNTQFHVRQSKKATIVVSLNWGAPGNKYLTKAYTDQVSKNRLKSIKIKRVTETENTTLYESNGNVFIRKQADNGFGAEGAPRSWTIDASGMTAVETEEIPA